VRKQCASYLKLGISEVQVKCNGNTKVEWLKVNSEWSKKNERSKLRKRCHVCGHGFETSLITNIKLMRPSLDEDKNECGKTDEAKITSSLVIIGLPYVRNFPNMSGISALKFVSGNSFNKCFDVRHFDSWLITNKKIE